MTTLRPRRWRQIGVAVAALTAVTVLAVMLASGLRHAPGEPGGSVLVGHRAPELSGRTLAGARFDPASLHGRVVLVNVWASWCTPCRHELPLLIRTARRYRHDGLRVVTINTRDGVVPAREFLGKVGAEPFLKTAVSDPSGERAVEWGATGVPETFLLDRHGVVRARCVGALTPAWLDAHLVPLLEPK